MSKHLRILQVGDAACAVTVTQFGLVDAIRTEEPRNSTRLHLPLSVTASRLLY